MLLFVDWQPDQIAFQIASIEVRWYSLFWIIGLVTGYFIMKRLFKEQLIEDEKFDPVFIYAFIGILLGARLGHCLFYEPAYYLSSWSHVAEMLLPFRQEGGEWVFRGYQGLASHGGTIGLFLAMLLYAKHCQLPFMRVIDNIAITTPIVACSIRLGNLMNSEIIGSPTDKPWGFIFHVPDALVDGQLHPRHPAQLYEAIAYLLIFIIGFILYRRMRDRVGKGFFFGWCMFAIFTFRFFVEFVKEVQVDFENNIPLDMGQLLSIPMLLIGAFFLWKGSRKEADKNSL